MIILPQEVINQFASHLRNNRAALARARLIGRAWDAACVAHLFCRIEFKVFDPFGCATDMGKYTEATFAAEIKRLQKRYNDLLDLLLSSPLLAHATKEITVMRAHRLEPSAWGSLEETYGKVLRQFKAVQTVRLKEVYFSHLSPSFVDAFLDVCGTGGVTRLEVLDCENGDLGNLTRIMRSLPSLQHLTLLLVHSTNIVDGKKHSEILSPASSSSLETSENGRLLPVRLASLTLEVSGAQTIADWLMCSSPILDLSRLRELRLQKTNNFHVHISPLVMGICLRSCAPSLELLEYRAPTSGERRLPDTDLKKVFNLERFPRLRQINFSGLRFSKDATTNLMPIICVVLSTANANSQLSIFNILVNVESSRDGSDIDWGCLSPIDEYLSDTKKFPFFECLDVVLVVRKRRYASTYVLLVKERLWRLSATNRVRVSVEW